MTSRKAAIIAFALASALVVAQSAGPLDLVVALDGSQSMFPYYDDVRTFVIGTLIKDYLRFGDNFTLLSFSDSTKVELSRRVETEADAKSLLASLYLLSPIGRYTDIPAALAAARDSAAEFSDDNRKLLVFVTDGVHNPAPGSEHENADADAVRAEVARIAAEITDLGWELLVIRIPFTARGEQGYPESGGEIGKLPPGSIDTMPAFEGIAGASVSEFDPAGMAGALSESLPLVILTPPKPDKPVDRRFEWVLSFENRSERAVTIDLLAVRLGGLDALAEKPAPLELSGGATGTLVVPLSLPSDFPSGLSEPDVELSFGPDCRVSPYKFRYALYVKEPVLESLFDSTLRVTLLSALAIALLACALLFFFSLRRASGMQGSRFRSLSSPHGQATGTDHAGSERPLGAESAWDGSELDAAAKARDRDLKARDDFDRRAAGALSVRDDHSLLDEAARSSKRDRRSMDEAALAYAKDEESPVALLGKAKAAAEAERVASARSFSEAASASKGEDDAILSEAAAKLRTEKELEMRSFETLAGEELAARRGLDDDAILAEAAERKRREARESLETYRSLASSMLASEERDVPPYAESPRLSGFRAAETSASFAPDCLVEMVVEDQNRHVGTRNVHRIRPGSRKTIGGGSSDFVVFLRKVPPRIAEIRNEGSRLVFAPLVPGMFPSIKEPVACVPGREYQVMASGGHLLRLSFVPYEKPGEDINRLFKILETPGVIGAKG